MKGSVILAMAAALFLAACSSGSDDGGGATTAPAPIPSGPAAGSLAEFQQVVGDRVFFGFDQFTLSPQARSVLQRQAQWLNQYAQYSLTVEGHADERGTRDYNLALGERRANAVREFLVSQGVSPTRLRTVTYGKERPVCAQSSESCWAQNRRGVSLPAG
ncbi:MAG: peptidoglycan-associated lipoprotein Pal [Rhodospirillaceae bacterium]